MAKLQGGARLEASTNVLLPRIKEDVILNARMSIANKTLPITKAQGTIRAGHEQPKSLPLRIQDGTLMGYWKPVTTSVHAIDLTVEAVLPGGTTINRSSFLTLEVQPALGGNWVFISSAALLFLMVLYFSIRRIRRRGHQAGVS